MRKSLTLLFILAISSTVAAQTLLRANDLQKDYLILRQAYEILHPGLCQYTSKAVMNAHFEECQPALDRNQTLAEAFSAVTRLTAAIRCGQATLTFGISRSGFLEGLIRGVDTELEIVKKLIKERQ